MDEIPDKMLLNIADAIGEGAKIVDLAVELGEDKGGAQRYQKMNMLHGEVSTNGTRKLLSDWKDDTRMADQRKVLKQALEEAGFKGIAAKYFGHPKRARLEETSEPQPSTFAKTRELEPDVDGYYTSFKVAPAKYDPARHTPESTYETWKSAEKGLVYILNNNKFPNCPSMKERIGSEIDVANMKHVFSELGYKSKIHTDLSRDGILKSIDEIVSDINAEPDKHSSLCLVLMSHGKKKGIFGADTSKGDERIVTIDEIKKKLSGRNCQGLLGKPKLLFTQACRGEDVTRSAMDSESSEQGTSSDVECDHVSIDFTEPSMPSVDGDKEGDQNLPENTDIFVANATSSGFYSIRDGREGSWFIQALSEVFLKHANVDDIHDLMLKVTNRVTDGFQTRTEKLGLKMPSMEVRQTPAYESQGMRKRFYFFPKYPSSK